VEACPKDAIRMDTGIVAMAYTERDRFDYTRDLLRDTYRENEKTKFHSVPLPLSEEEALPNSVGKVAP
jgi:formate hydrogenlyase subunit 6/NADH:ubiquinone oxidoreductase subunit I